MNEEIPHIRKAMTPEMKKHLETLKLAQKATKALHPTYEEESSETPQKKITYILPDNWTKKEFKHYKRTHRR